MASPTRLILGLVLVVAALAHGCGRTSLDDGFGTADGSSSVGGSGTGGQAGAGLGGMVGGGQGGIVAGSMVTCGRSACVAGRQSCCNRIAGGQAMQSCIDVTDPTGCLDGVVLCSGDILCPKVAPSCCIQALGVGYCQPAGLACMPLRP